MSTSMNPRRAAALLLAAAPFARPIAAQAAPKAAESPDSVEVRRGDTLWGLASQRLGSPYRWPAIREANAERIADPHWIYPGQRLRLPGDAATVAAPSAAPADDAAPAAAAMPATALFERAPERPAAAPAPAAGWPGLDTATRFLAHVSMPYVAERGELAGAGTVVDDADGAQRAGGTAKQRFGLQDRVVLTLPRGDGVDAAPGRRVTIVRRATDAVGRVVVVPTAIARVDGIAGDFVTARLVHLFDGVTAGQHVLPGWNVAMPTTGGAHASTRSTRVEWIAGSAALPTIGSVVILGSGSADHVEADDRFELLGPDRRIGSGTLRGTRVALVRVMRVTEHTATAIVVAQEQPAIAVGMAARPIARDELRPASGGR